MAKAGFTGVRSTMAEIRKEVKALELKAVQEVKSAGNEAIRALFSRTPVWEGEIVRNYVVGLDKPVGGAVKQPINNGPPGPTSTMSLGEEPRRGVNEAAAYAEIAGKIYGMKSLRSLFFTNNSPMFDQADAGAAPEPGAARNPGGIVMLAEQIVRAARGGNWK